MNKIQIEGEIGFETTAKEVVNQLKGMSGDLTVEINSVGGSVYNGIQIFNALFEYDKGHITTVNKGMAASMASYIMLVGDTIKSYSNATYMIHNALTFAYGNSHDLRKTANHLEALSTVIANKYVDKTGKSMDEVKQMMDDETFLYGTEMQDHGFVDEVIDVEKNTSKESAFAMHQNEFQACLASSKEHCKIEGYNGSLDEVLDTLATMPSDEKIVNQTIGAEMSVTKEEFDAIQSKYDSLVASNDEATAKLEEVTPKLDEAAAKIEDLEKALGESNKAEVIAFCGANRNAVNYAKETEFLTANATLQEVMDFAMEQEQNAPEENLDIQDKQTTVVGDYLAQAIAQQNKGEL